MGRCARFGVRVAAAFSLRRVDESDSKVLQEDGAEHNFLASRFHWMSASGFLSFLAFAYLYFAWQSLTIFDCVDLGGSQGRRLREDVSVECVVSDTRWRSYLVAAVFGILLYVIGIPMLLLLIIRRATSTSCDILLGTAYTSLTPQRRWWLVGILLWKLLVVCTLRLLLTHTLLQIVLFSSLLYTNGVHTVRSSLL